MTVAASCLDHDSLKSLLEHRAGAEQIEQLAKHLESCPRCGETVDALLASDPTEAALRGAKVAPDEPSIQLLRARLANLRIADASHETTAGENTQSVGSPPSLEATQTDSVSLAPPQQPDEIGRLGGYRLLSELGRGGMGVVYKAEDLKLKRLVALKVMAPSLAANAVSRERFLREAVAMAAVHHDNIVVIHTVDEANGVPFLAMEFLQGMPLDKWLKEGHKASVAQVLRMGREIAEGLAAAHERGLIHRDVKPGNIWLDSSHKDRVKILDFGLARSGTEDVHLTHSGAIVGTPAYMSPEQARGEKVDARCDLFSLGCVLYKLCTGVTPFAGDTTMALLMSLGLDHPKTVRKLNPDMPEELSDLVARLLAKKPEERPQSAREVVEAINRIDEGRAAGFIPAGRLNPAGINPAARPTNASGGKKRRPRVVAAVAAGFLAAAIIVAIVIIIRDKNGNEVAKLNVPAAGSVDIHDEPKKDGPTIIPKAAVDDAWSKKVHDLPVEKQVEEVAAELKRRNPGFDGNLDYTLKDNEIAGLILLTDDVADLTPLRALPALTGLSVCGHGARTCRLLSLSTIKGLKLTKLKCDYTRVSDLSPLKGMPLTQLECDYTRVSDLSPLKGMPLTMLSCWDTPVSDLSPLKEMKLKTLSCQFTEVSDLSPLKGMPLKNIFGDFKPARDAEILRSIKTLETINGMPAAEFFKEVDAKKPEKKP